MPDPTVGGTPDPTVDGTPHRRAPGAAVPGTGDGSAARLHSGPPGRPWSGGGREALAAAVRRLMELTVTSAPAEGAFADATSRIDALCDELAATVPEDGPRPVGRFAEGSVGPDEVSTLAAAMPFDMVVGSCNPLAPPIDIRFDPPRAFGEVVFAPHYEGAPGCVHGAAIAAAFDIILTAANVVADAAGPTVELSIRYLKPTLIGVDSVFESQVTEVTDRRTHSVGRLLQDGMVKVEAKGEFVNVPRARINAMHRVPGGGGKGA